MCVGICLGAYTYTYLCVFVDLVYFVVLFTTRESPESPMWTCLCIVNKNHLIQSIRVIEFDK